MAKVEEYVLPPRKRKGEPRPSVEAMTEAERNRYVREHTRWRVRYRTPDRKQTDRGGFRKKGDAVAFAVSVEASKQRGEFIDAAAARTTLGELGAAWLDRQGHLKPSAHRVVESAWRVHVEPRWAEVRVADVRFTDVAGWVAELGGRRGATTTIRAYGVLAAVLDDAVRDRRLLTNPARGVSLPRKVHRGHVYLDHRQVDALARAAGEHATLVRVLAYTGLRWGEAVGLRVRDVAMLRRRLTVESNAVEVGSRIYVGTPKGHRVRSVPFPALLAEGLAVACAGKGPDALVFGDGEHLRRSHHGGWFAAAVAQAGTAVAELQESLPVAVTGVFDEATAAALAADQRAGGRQVTGSASVADWAALGVERVEVLSVGSRDFARLTPHTLRHTAASLAVASGASVKAVQKMLGHASATMTLDVYADLFDGDLDDVGAAMDRAASAALDHGGARGSVGRMWAENAPPPLHGV